MAINSVFKNSLLGSLTKFGSAVAIASVLTFGSLSGANESQAQEVNRAEIEKIIRSYLLENPELMLEVQEALAQKQEQLRIAKQSETLKSMNEQIFHSTNQMTIGDPNAKTTIVEFFDYNCGYCRRALSDMERIVKENPDVKFVMKEFPVLGDASNEAHQVSLAVIKSFPELYDAFHKRLLSTPGAKNGAKAMELAVELGADPAKLQALLGTKEISDAIQEVYAIADGLGITGTPSYVVGDEVVFGAVGYDRLMPKIASLKTCGKTVC